GQPATLEGILEQTKTSEQIHTAFVSSTTPEDNITLNIDTGSITGEKESAALKAALSDANFKKAHLEQAKFQKAHLHKANLEESTIKGANFQGADLEDTKFKDAIMCGDVFDQATSSRKYICANFIEAKNLTPEQVKSAKNWEK
ncbi:MAG: pentapeptide repeat-containing protein, partial [Dolichospermum sp.]